MTIENNESLLCPVKVLSVCVAITANGSSSKNYRFLIKYN